MTSLQTQSTQFNRFSRPFIQNINVNYIMTLIEYKNSHITRISYMFHSNPLIFCLKDVYMGHHRITSTENIQQMLFENSKDVNYNLLKLIYEKLECEIPISRTEISLSRMPYFAGEESHILFEFRFKKLNHKVITKFFLQNELYEDNIYDLLFEINSKNQYRVHLNLLESVWKGQAKNKLISYQIEKTVDFLERMKN